MYIRLVDINYFLNISIKIFLDGLNNSKERNGTKYEMRLAKAAPGIPYKGIRNTLRITFEIIPRKIVIETIFVRFSAIRICWVNRLIAAPMLLQTYICNTTRAPIKPAPKTTSIRYFENKAVTRAVMNEIHTITRKSFFIRRIYNSSDNFFELIIAGKSAPTIMFGMK